MTGEQIPSLITQTIDELRARGILITNRAVKWRVKFRDGAPATGYVTDDLEDAFARGLTLGQAATASSATAARH